MRTISGLNNVVIIKQSHDKKQWTMGSGARLQQACFSSRTLKPGLQSGLNQDSPRIKLIKQEVKPD